MVGFSRSSNSSRSCRRRLAHGASRNASNCFRPASRNSFFWRCRMALYLGGKDKRWHEDLPPKEATQMSRDTKYIGMDVHKEAVVIAVRNSTGQLVMESIVETKASSLLQFIHGLQGELHVTWEEGTWAVWLYDCMSRRRLMYSVGNRPTRGKVRPL